MTTLSFVIFIVCLNYRFTGRICRSYVAFIVLQVVFIVLHVLFIVRSIIYLIYRIYLKINTDPLVPKPQNIECQKSFPLEIKPL